MRSQPVQPGADLLFPRCSIVFSRSGHAGRSRVTSNARRADFIELPPAAQITMDFHEANKAGRFSYVRQAQERRSLWGAAFCGIERKASHVKEVICWDRSIEQTGKRNFKKVFKSS